MLRRLALSASVSLLALAAAPAATAQADPLLPLPRLIAAPDRLHVTVTGADGELDGDYTLHCNPAGGTHPNAEGACDKLASMELERGVSPFEDTRKERAQQRAGKAPMCTMQYGGPAKAHIKGVWHSKRVDVTYDRGNGCSISRWNEMVPVIPAIGRS
ncbi:subtilase-type protease inhibitor [Streptomyces sp. SCSIO ZS0520]|uniref:subtilase-type protease inhibitor n=1 Tax=Streptomyces sp. SCSIO ZS0520 TaxID=2892996 RepID=UPI0021DA2631|nr:subtilase-type protease inhibitor [Streptomyces sp. SCSIO ZS0520]